MDQKGTPSGSSEDNKVVAPVSAQWRDSRQSEASPSLSDSIARGKDAVAAAKDTAVDLVSQASGHAARSARDFAANVTGQVGDMAGDLANRGANAAAAATAQAKSFGAELETMARRNPLGAIAAAVAIGALIGLLGRRR